ncbi:hypothetical protein [Agrobacterium sp.]|nr:hypothetical protein [Agrobacterium sp.]
MSEGEDRTIGRGFALGANYIFDVILALVARIQSRQPGMLR